MRLETYSNDNIIRIPASNPVRTIIGLLLILLVSSCNVQKYLSEETQLVVRNTVEVEQPTSLRFQKEILPELEKLITLSPNDKSFFFFKTKLWYYYRIQAKSDTSNFDRFILNNIAEPPSYSDSVAIDGIAEKMKRYLFSEGYLNAYVKSDISSQQKGDEIKYSVYPNKRFFIRESNLQCRDTAVQSVLENNQSASYLKTGSVFNATSWNNERERIVDLLQNNGFSEFSFNNISARPIITDTISNNVVFEWFIFPPDAASNHQRKRIGDVSISYNPTESVTPKIETLDSITFLDYSDDARIKSNTLLNFLYLRPGDLYNRNNELLTRQLLNLSAFRNVQVNRAINEADSSRVNYSIVIRPVQKIDFDMDLEINSNVRNVIGSPSNTFFGTAFSTSITDNNFLGGFERFTNSLTFNVEIGNNSATTDRSGLNINSLNILYNSNLSLPRFTDYFGLYQKFGDWGLLRSEVLTNWQRSANSLINLNVEFVSLQDWYTYRQIQLSYGFSNTVTRLGRTNSVSIQNLQLTYFDPTTDSLLVSTYQENSFVLRSFSPQLFTGFLFSGIQYIVDRPAVRRNLSSRVKYSAEISGLEAATVEAIRGNNRKPLEIGSLGFSKYILGEFDGSLYYSLNNSSTLVLRGNLGIASPYGNSSNVPFVKQFFVGGANTIRAWRVRELGPGGFLDTNTTDPNQTARLDKSGDFKLLFNTEYRFDIFWRFKGALFLDAGNVWNLIDDEQRSDDLLTSGFLNQMAVGTGIGLRIDITYFTFVVDLGIKLRYPYALENNSNWVFGSAQTAGDLSNFNLLINYPF